MTTPLPRAARPTTTAPNATPATPTASDSTALATRRSMLSPEHLARIEERKAHTQMVQAIRGATWAKVSDLSDVAVRAIGAWAIAADIDPVTEIDVLGGNVYINADYYERKLSELIGLGVIAYARPDWIHHDQRLDVLADEGDEASRVERVRRLRERVLHNVPENADHAAVYRVKHRGMDEEITGVKFHVPGKKKTVRRKGGTGTYEVDADPIGDAAPETTIETRALRRAMLKLRAALPGDVKLASSRDEDVVSLSSMLGEERARLARQRADAPREHFVVTGDARNPYALPDRAPDAAEGSVTPWQSAAALRDLAAPPAGGDDPLNPTRETVIAWGEEATTVLNGSTLASLEDEQVDYLARHLARVPAVWRPLVQAELQRRAEPADVRETATVDDDEAGDDGTLADDLVDMDEDDDDDAR